VRALPAAVEGARRARRRHWRPLLCSPVYSVDVSTWPVTPAAMAQPASLDRVDARATAWGEGADIFVVGCVCLPARGKSERRRRRRTRVLASSAIFFFLFALSRGGRASNWKGRPQPEPPLSRHLLPDQAPRASAPPRPPDEYRKTLSFLHSSQRRVFCFFSLSLSPRRQLPSPHHGACACGR